MIYIYIYTPIISHIPIKYQYWYTHSTHRCVQRHKSSSGAVEDLVVESRKRTVVNLEAPLENGKMGKDIFTLW